MSLLFTLKNDLIVSKCKKSIISLNDLVPNDIKPYSRVNYDGQYQHSKAVTIKVVVEGREEKLQLHAPPKYSREYKKYTRNNLNYITPI